jgi:hypothetical protein
VNEFLYVGETYIKMNRQAACGRFGLLSTCQSSQDVLEPSVSQPDGYNAFDPSVLALSSSELSLSV